MTIATDPPVSEAQRRAMFAAAAGHSTLGIPKKVGEEFVGKDAGGTDFLRTLKHFGRAFLGWISEEESEGEHAGAATDAINDEPTGRAASIAFVAPDGEVLFVKRAPTEENFPDHWGLPGGKQDDGETTEDCARREASEEVGRDCSADELTAVDTKRTERGWDHTTYAAPVTDKFEPKLNAEHSEWRWAPLSSPPDPLHPGVKATIDGMLSGAKDALATVSNSAWPLLVGGGLKKKPAADEPAGKLSETTREEVDSTKYRKDMPENAFLGPSRTYPVKIKEAGGWKYTRDLLLAAARRARLHGRTDIARRADAIREREFGGSVDVMMLLAADEKRFDVDGHMHTSNTPLTKSNICEYLGSEIPEFQKHGLDPNKRYKLLRHPDELKKAVDSFNGLPVLSEHRPVSAENHPEELVIGSTGSSAVWDPPYIRNDLYLWPQKAIDRVANGKARQISAAYRYRYDPTPGTYDGEDYSGIMRDVLANHIAAVLEGRVGEDVAVDGIPITWDTIEKTILFYARPPE